MMHRKARRDFVKTVARAVVQELKSAGLKYQEMFNPVDFAFRWTSDWYTWDHARAKREALAKRKKVAKRLKAEGHRVRLFTLSGQRITRGGIGSKHPEISLYTSVYGLEYR